MDHLESSCAGRRPPGTLPRGGRDRAAAGGRLPHYGYDFRDYASSSIRRRLRHLLAVEGIPSISDLTEKVLHDPGRLDRPLAAFSINVSAMFRDPSFYRAFRDKLVPILRTYPFVRIWHAGLFHGEEVYSTAILLHEAGLYDRCRIYATDINEAVLRKARDGIFPSLR